MKRSTSRLQPRPFGFVAAAGRLAAFALAAATFGAPRSWAMPASPHPFDVQQSDGQRVRLHVRGDEHFNWLEDTDGYTVVRHDKTYVYATLGAGGRLAPTAHAVGRANPRAVGLGRHVLPPKASRPVSELSALPQEAIAPDAPKAANATGIVKNLVIMMRFADHQSRPAPSNQNISTIFNAVGGDPNLAPTGSVRDLYRENSYGALTLDSTVVGWVTLPRTESYYAGGASGLTTTIWDAINDALKAADPLIDFAQFDRDADGFVDAIAFIHSGYGAEWGGVDAYGADYQNRIWSHQWAIPTWTSAEGVKVSPYHISPALWGTSGSQPGRIGVIAHETGHFLGLPDLYDTNGGGEGIGSYCLMANSWGFTGDQLNPPHLSAWSKIKLGWLVPTPITASGTYQAPQVETNPAVFKITNGYPPGEFLLVENRQPTGFERTMPQGGLAIWHIDETKGGNYEEGYPGQEGWPTNNRHYKVALLQADGDYGLERGWGRGDGGDVYHGNGVSTIDSTTVPGTNGYQDGIVTPTGNRLSFISISAATMSFQYSNGCDYSLAPTSQSFSASGGSSTVTVAAAGGCGWAASSNNGWITVTSGAAGSGSGAVGYTVESNPTPYSRTGTLSIAGRTFTVTQTGSLATPAGLSPGSTYPDGSVVVGASPVALRWNAVTGADRYEVMSFYWNAATAAWVSVPTASTTTSSLSYSLPVPETHYAWAVRALSGTTAGDWSPYAYFVYSAPACGFTLSATSASFGRAGGSGTVTVTAPSGCAWTASSSARWLTITAGGSGNGSGTVSYRVKKNVTRQARTGTMTIAGTAFTVTQASR
jgi:M6 family metalloprotease-like protein